MSKLIFKLASAPEEEVTGVKKALEHAEIEFYETSGGSWGWSLPGLWVKDNNNYLSARKVIDEFQAVYVSSVRDVTPVARRGNDRMLFTILVIMIVSAVAYGWMNQWF
jgi:hypothetical protein